MALPAVCPATAVCGFSVRCRLPAKGAAMFNSTPPAAHFGEWRTRYVANFWGNNRSYSFLTTA